MSTPASAMASASAPTTSAASTTAVISGTEAKTNLEQWLSIVDQWKAHIPMFQNYVINVIEKRKKGEVASMQLLLPTNNPVTIYANPNTIVNKIELDCAWFNTARIEQPLRMALRLHCKPTPEEAHDDPDSDETPPEIKFQQGFRHLAQMIGTSIEEPIGSGNRVNISYVHVNIGLHLLDHLQPLFNHLVTHCGVPSQLINRLQDPIFYRPLSAAEKTFYQDVLTAFRRSALDRKEIYELVKRAQVLDADFSKNLLDRHMKDEWVSGMVGREKEFSSKEEYRKHLKDGQYFTSISSATYTLGKLCFEFKAFDLVSDILSHIKKRDAFCPSADWIKIQMLCTQCDESQTKENRQKRKVIMAQLSDCDHLEAQALSDRLTELHFGRSSAAMQQTIETSKVPFFVRLRENPDFDPDPMEVIAEMEKVFPAPAAKTTAAAAKSGSATSSILSTAASAKQVDEQRLQKENSTLASIALMIASATATAADKPAPNTASAVENATGQPVNTIANQNLGGHIVGTAVIATATMTTSLPMFDAMRAASANPVVSSTASAAHYQPSTAASAKK